jgi:pilus assembly protein FimV
VVGANRPYCYADSTYTRGVIVGKSVTLGVLAGLLSIAPWFAQAAGLGELRVTSTLGQPLRGEIPVVSVKPGEEGLSASIASMAAYANAGLAWRATLTGTQLTVVSTKRGPVIQLKGAQSLNEPAIDLLVELRWPSGRVLRTYRVLLDRPKN